MAQNMLPRADYPIHVPTSLEVIKQGQKKQSEFVVTSSEDGAVGSLRHIIEQSPINSVFEVSFDSSVKRIFLEGSIYISHKRKVLIKAEHVSLVQTQLGSIFEVEADSKLYLVGLNLESAKSKSAVVSSGKVLVKSCVFQYNASGAIQINAGELAVDTCLFYKNYSPIGGAAIRIEDGAARAKVKDSTFRLNRSRDLTGEIYSQGNIQIERSVFHATEASNEHLNTSKQDGYQKYSVDNIGSVSEARTTPFREKNSVISTTELESGYQSKDTFHGINTIETFSGVDTNAAIYGINTNTDMPVGMHTTLTLHDVAPTLNLSDQPLSNPTYDDTLQQAENKFASYTKYIDGLMLTLACILVSFPLARLPYLDKVGPLILALGIGMIASRFIRQNGEIPERYTAGIKLSAKTLLKLGIVFLGVRLNFALIAALGFKIVFANMLVITLGLLTAEFLGRKIGLSASLRRILGVGSSICGASAIAAAIPVLNPKNEEVALSITVISVLGTLAVIIYTAVAQTIGPDSILYGVFIGATLQEVAQVVAAGFSFNAEAGDTALVIKLMRVAMLAPVLMLIGLLPTEEKGDGKRPPLLPWFLGGFLIFGVLNSLGIIPEFAVNILVQISLYLTALAMAAIGIGINVNGLGKYSLKAIVLGLACLVVMVLFMLLYIAFVLG